MEAASIVQQANDEADAVEAELGPDVQLEPDGDNDEEEGAEAESEPDASSLAVVKERDRKLTAEARRHETALSKLHPDDWESHVMCPLCVGDGYLLPIAPGAQPDELWEAIRALSGRTDEGGLKMSRFAVLCEDCDGYGEVLTGAHTMQGAQIPCELCKAKGWYDPTDPMSFHRRLIPQTQSAPTQLAAVQDPMNAPIDGVVYMPPPGHVATPHVNGNDAYGRWQGHPRYGIDPQFTGGTW